MLIFFSVSYEHLGFFFQPIGMPESQACILPRLCFWTPMMAATLSTLLVSGMSVASRLSTTFPLYLMFPMCSRAARICPIGRGPVTE
jgi:hypothetical protein